MNDYASVFRYVPHWRVSDYLALGWVADTGLDRTHHGAYARLMWWPLDKGEPKEPAQ